MARPASFRSTSLTLTLLAAALVAPAAARANGMALDIQGVFSNGTASAGAASTHDVAGMFGNPAIIGFLDGFNLVAGGQLIAGKAPYTDKGSALPISSAPVTGVNRDGATTGPSPWVFASYRVTPDLAVGFSFYAPFGTKTDYGQGSNFVGRYWGVESAIESIAFGPAVAWKPIPQFSFGVSAAARRDKATLGQALDLGSGCVGDALLGGAPDYASAAAYCQTTYGLVPGETDGYGRFTGTGWGWTLTGGVAVEPAPGTHFGIAYRHESKSRVKGTETADPLTMTVMRITGTPAAFMDLPLPDFMTINLEQKIGKSLSLLATLQVTFWNAMDTLELEARDPNNGLSVSQEQGFGQTVRVSGAGVYTVMPGVDVFGGVAFEQSPVTTRYRAATLPERDALIAGLGAEAKLWRGLTVGACYQRVQMLGTSQIDQTTPGSGDRLYGSVKGSANVATAQIGWKG